MVELQSSKLITRVRFPSSPPLLHVSPSPPSAARRRLPRSSWRPVDYDKMDHSDCEGSRVMPIMGETAPVFADDTGRRARMLQWLLRGGAAALVAVSVVLAVSLVTGLPLPGLGGPVRLPGFGGTSSGPVKHPASHKTESTPAGATSATSAGRAVTSRATVAGPGSVLVTSTHPSRPAPAVPTSQAQPTPSVPTGAGPTPTPAPTPAHPGKKSTKTPNFHATGAPRANPSKAPGGPPATPPGKSK